MFAPVSEHPWRDVWPAVTQADDGNPWVTGGCWLYCRREGVRVLWVGSVNTPGATGDMFACAPCLAELDHMVRVQSHSRDAPVPLATRGWVWSSPVTRRQAAGCEHRQTEQCGGKTHCRDCKHQLYL